MMHLFIRLHLPWDDQRTWDKRPFERALRGRLPKGLPGLPRVRLLGLQALDQELLDQVARDHQHHHQRRLRIFPLRTKELCWSVIVILLVLEEPQLFRPLPELKTKIPLKAASRPARPTTPTTASRWWRTSPPPSPASSSVHSTRSARPSPSSPPSASAS